jgi:acyl dehydratase
MSGRPCRVAITGDGYSLIACRFSLRAARCALRASGPLAPGTPHDPLCTVALMDIISRLEAAVGTEIGTGDWVDVTQDRVDAFADATDDHQWIHQAGERAFTGPFGGPIAHGLFTLSLTPSLTRPIGTSLSEGSRMTINYGFDRVRWITPVPVPSRVRARVRVIEAIAFDGGVQVKNEVTVELEGAERPAMVAENLVRYYV